jgi:hypothetical protein
MVPGEKKQSISGTVKSEAVNPEKLAETLPLIVAAAITSPPVARTGGAGHLGGFRHLSHWQKPCQGWVAGRPGRLALTTTAFFQAQPVPLVAGEGGLEPREREREREGRGCRTATRMQHAQVIWQAA